MNKPKALPLESEHKKKLEKLAGSDMPPILIALRTKILLYKAEGCSDDSVAEELGVNRRTVMLWCRKYKERNPEDTVDKILSVSDSRSHKEEIIGEAKIWLIGVACTRPKELGYAAETWTTETLTRHIRKYAAEAGVERLAGISASGVCRILNKCNIKPFRIRYN